MAEKNTETDETTIKQYVLQGQLEAQMRALGTMHRWITLAYENGQLRAR